MHLLALLSSLLATTVMLTEGRYLRSILTSPISDGHVAERRSVDNRVVSIYDRNCFFSPMGCHFLHGRRARMFIRPSELAKKEDRLKRLQDEDDKAPNVITTTGDVDVASVAPAFPIEEQWLP